MVDINSKPARPQRRLAGCFCLLGRCGLELRVFKKEAHHLAAGIRPLRFGVGPIRTSTGPGVTCPMKNPMLEHRVSAVIARDRAGIADPARSLTAADRRSQ